MPGRCFQKKLVEVANSLIPGPISRLSTPENREQYFLQSCLHQPVSSEFRLSGTFRFVRSASAEAY